MEYSLETAQKLSQSMTKEEIREEMTGISKNLEKFKKYTNVSGILGIGFPLFTIIDYIISIQFGKLEDLPGALFVFIFLSSISVLVIIGFFALFVLYLNLVRKQQFYQDVMIHYIEHHLDKEKLDKDAVVTFTK